MKKALFSTLFFLFLFAEVHAQMPQNRITWNSEPLTWENFIGEPDPSNPFHANTSSGLSYSWSMKTSGSETEFIYDVGAFFFPEESWVKQGKLTNNLLIHEQLHFDITELHARKLRKAMEEFDLKKTKNVKAALQAIYKRTETERAIMQNKFDAETRHSMDEAEQLKWQKFIQQELLKLKEFSS